MDRDMLARMMMQMAARQGPAQPPVDPAIMQMLQQYPQMSGGAPLPLAETPAAPVPVGAIPLPPQAGPDYANRPTTTPASPSNAFANAKRRRA